MVSVEGWPLLSRVAQVGLDSALRLRLQKTKTKTQTTKKNTIKLTNSAAATDEISMVRGEPPGGSPASGSTCKTLGAFAADADVCLLPFARDCVVHYLDAPSAAVRTAAGPTCAARARANRRP